MIKRIFLLLGLLLIVACVFAQAPDWQWASQAGGTYYDEGMAITIDNAGNSYVTGPFRDTATFGSYSLTSNDTDIFVAKMDADGNWLWATQAGGTHYDYGGGIAVDNNGNSYVIGCFNYTATFGSYSLTSSGEYDIFVAKMDSTGNWLWATKAGGSWDDFGNGITVDAAGNIYVIGYFRGTATFGSHSITSSGLKDIFVAKIDANGNWQWAIRAGGTDNDRGFGITIDAAGNIYVTGYFQGTATFGSYSLTSSGEEDIFAAKMDADGNWQLATRAGGTDDDRGFGITVDAAGNIYVTGYFQGTATFGSCSLTSSGWDDVFVTKIDANGNWQWAIQAGGVDHDIGIGITIDAAGNSYVAGCFGDTATFGPYSLTSSGLNDIFVAKIDSDGNWHWVTQAGGNYFVAANGITSDDAGNTYITGEFGGTVTFGSYFITSSGKEDIFAAKMDTDGNWQWATKAGGNFYAIGHGITIDDTGNCYVTGCFGDAVTFGSYSLTSLGHGDIFVAKLNSSVSVENEIISTEMEVSNYPNPFNPSTTIYFETTSRSRVETTAGNLHENSRIEIFNIKGQKIKTFLSFPNWGLGTKSVVWDGRDENNQPVGSGIYLYQLRTGDKNSQTRKMLLVK